MKLADAQITSCRVVPGDRHSVWVAAEGWESIGARRRRAAKPLFDTTEGCEKLKTRKAKDVV
jgi:hypothetical protein